MPADGRPIVDHYWIKQGDTLPSIEAVLLDGDGEPVTVFGTTVNFHMRLQGDAEAKVDAAAVVLDTGVGDENKGRVRYDWADDDTEDAGVFDAEWEVTTTEGGRVTFPNPGNLTVTITEQLA